MKKKTNYKSAPVSIKKAIEGAEIIEDFLPPPEKLILKDKTVKITISLSKNSIDFFKKNAEKNGISYQTMIRKILDIYAAHYCS